MPLPDHRLHVVLKQHRGNRQLFWHVDRGKQEIADDEIDRLAFDDARDLALHRRRPVLRHRIRKRRREVAYQLPVETGRSLRSLAHRDAHQIRAILLRALDCIGAGAAVIESQIRDAMATDELAKHVVRADPSTLVEWMEKLGLEPENMHVRPFPRGGGAAGPSWCAARPLAGRRQRRAARPPRRGRCAARSRD